MVRSVENGPSVAGRRERRVDLDQAQWKSREEILRGILDLRPLDH
jgi:hypothetical protein